jgi:hypothetical protein
MLEVNEYSVEEKKKIKEYFLRSLDNGVSITEASEAAGITRVTIWLWRRDDEEFNNEVNSVLDSRVQTVEDALYINATAKNNIVAQIFFLKNRSKGRWKDKTEADIDITHKGLDYDEYKKIKEMDKDERKLLIEKLSKLCGDKDDRPVGEDQKKD